MKRLVFELMIAQHLWRIYTIYLRLWFYSIISQPAKNSNHPLHALFLISKIEVETQQCCSHRPYPCPGPSYCLGVFMWDFSVVFIYLFIYSFFYSIIYWLIYSFIHSFIYCQYVHTNRTFSLQVIYILHVRNYTSLIFKSIFISDTPIIEKIKYFLHLIKETSLKIKTLTIIEPIKPEISNWFPEKLTFFSWRYFRKIFSAIWISAPPD